MSGKAVGGRARAGLHGGIHVPAEKMTTLRGNLAQVYAFDDLSTTCCRQCTCCRVACPQMKYSEAANIIDLVFDKTNGLFTRDERKHILVQCVRYFFSDSLVKPCLLLDGYECRVYDSRPLNCRLFGLWPHDDWEKRVANFVKSTGLPREKLPLNVQCPNVRRAPQECVECKGAGKPCDGQPKPGDVAADGCKVCGGTGKVSPSPLTGAQVSKLFNSLDALDAVMGVSEAKIKASWNYRTFHDWVLLKFWGEDALVQWTNMILNNTQEERDKLLEVFEAMVETVL